MGSHLRRTLLELPVSQLLYPPDHPPIAVGITKALANYDYGGETAIEVTAVALALIAVAVVWGRVQPARSGRMAPRREDDA